MSDRIVMGARRLVDGIHVRVGNEMTWPGIGEQVHALAYRLRYPSGVPITDHEAMLAAGIVDAYIALIQKPVRLRNPIIAALRSVATDKLIGQSEYEAEYEKEFGVR